MPATRTPKTPTMKLADIKVREGFNVRSNGSAADGDLAESIKLVGILEPLIVTPAGELIAGERRYRAAKLAGLDEAPVIFRAGDAKDEAAVHAAENMARAQLSPAEEATAIQKMKDAGFSIEGAGKVLGMSAARVTRRLALLSLPEEIRELWGPDSSAKLESVSTVAALLEKAPELAPIVAAAHQITDPRNLPEDEEPYDAVLSVDLLHRSPRRYMSELCQATEYIDELPEWPERITLGESGDTISANNLTGFGADEETITRFADAEKAKQKLYNPWNMHMRVSDEDLDAARAAGVTVTLGDEHERCEFILDGAWLRERINSDILPRYEKEIAAQAQKDKRRTGDRMANSDRARDAASGKIPDGELTDRERREKRIRELEREAAKRWREEGVSVNETLGKALLNELSTVELTVEVARFFAEATLGVRPNRGVAGGDYGRTYGEDRHAARLAAAGLRYVMPNWQKHVPKPTKANPKKTVIEYMTPEEAEKALWKYFDAAETPQEILGRALIIHAAAAWACEEVLAASHRIMGSHTSSTATHSYRTTLPQNSFALLRKIPAVKGAIPPVVAKLVREISNFDARKLVDKEQEKADAKPKAEAKPKAGRSAAKKAAS